MSISVVVTAQAADKSATSEETRTEIVNAHGALMFLEMKTTIGQLITMKNNMTGEEVACRVVFTRRNTPDKSEVALEFIKPAPSFWRISFPPPDWTPRSPEAKTYVERPATRAFPTPKK
ncbi:MAG TPA: hypothetical protein VHE23_00365 [Candidatus Acidoferrales bacterium]|nr:hypothetical protein [Candidatus Acidoferrales bacterium]